MLEINMLKPSLMSEQRVTQSRSEENDECKNGVMEIDELEAQLHETEDIVNYLREELRSVQRRQLESTINGNNVVCNCNTPKLGRSGILSPGRVTS
nr:hypothetical protein [Tanacetum cinerariifolium]